jgi:cytochrome c oxidase assembly protein subunit 15
MTTTTHRVGLYTPLVNLSLLLTLAAVVLSAYIRLKSVGLGCDDWPSCYAQLSLAQKPSAIPTTVAGAIHRVTATLLGLLVMTITFMAIRRRSIIGTRLWVPLLAFALIIFLSVLGFNTPTWQIPVVALGNLTGGMALAALLWWMSLRSIADNTTTIAAENLIRPWVIFGLVIVSLQIALGSWVSANFAAAACPDLFTCQDDWASMSSLVQGLDISRHIAMNDTGRIIFDSTQPTLNMAHRIGAILTLL